MWTKDVLSALSDEGLAQYEIKGLYETLLNPSLNWQMEDGIIRKNPLTGTLGDYGAPAKEKEAIDAGTAGKLLNLFEQVMCIARLLPMCRLCLGLA